MEAALHVAFLQGFEDQFGVFDKEIAALVLINPEPFVFDARQSNLVAPDLADGHSVPRVLTSGSVPLARAAPRPGAFASAPLSVPASSTRRRAARISARAR